MRVILESPYVGKTPAERAGNIAYARAAMRDCLLRGESPFASHLLYTQPGVLDDDDAEERAIGITSDDVTLAIMCAGERSPLHLDTCTAMVNVVARTAARRGISIGAQARAYSAVFKGTARPWLRELNARGTRPPSWPRASWTRYRPAWMAVLDHVRALLAGNVPPVCDESARHFGNAQDGRRMGAFVRMCEHVDESQHFWGKQELRDAAAVAPTSGPPHHGELPAPRNAGGAL